MARKVLRFSAAEAADVLRGSKSALLKDAADLRDLEISDGAVLCGETDEGTAFCELRVTSFFQGPFSSLPQDIVLDDGMKAKKFEAGVEVAHIKFEVVKVLSAASMDSKHFWGPMAAADIPSKTTLHPTFMEAIESAWSQEHGGSVLDLGCGDGRIAVELIRAAAAAGG
eukprot:CAMPEP_0177693562 /NCGR_PEP_ID=MMETSP0484_2-20121128/2466_1 /TAXON_ID=354590 /ORGANISM="Rhodomonas lens, Strain RHODO" /LENGTH=168 /DNA_ID=CAMNT_0019204381 /DNA_START=58 /DNA_END=561 /DNA_ORIENTATION=+